MTPQPVEGLDRGERLLQLRLAENRMAAAGQIQEMSQILEGAMERIYGTQEDGKLEQEIGRRMKLMGVQVEKVFFYGPKGKETADLSGHEDEKEDLRAGEKSGGRLVGASGL